VTAYVTASTGKESAFTMAVRAVKQVKKERLFAKNSSMTNPWINFDQDSKGFAKAAAKYLIHWNHPHRFRFLVCRTFLLGIFQKINDGLSTENTRMNGIG
jgi:hypothetical protein